MIFFKGVLVTGNQFTKDGFEMQLGVNHFGKRNTIAF